MTSKNNTYCHKLLTMFRRSTHTLLLLLLTLGSGSVWGQTPKVPDGIYYIRNNNSLSYGYLWPSITTNSTTGYRYLTTSLDVTADAVTNNNGVSYPAHDKSYSHWVVKNITGGYIQLINPRLNKYVVLRKFPKANNTKGNEYGDRDVWLTDEPAAEDIEYTYFVLNNNDSPYKISPKAGLNNVATTTGYSFNSASGNSDRVWLTWSKTDNKPQNGEGREGLIQLYSGGTPAWSFTSDLLDAPEISDVNENSIVTVTDANGLPDGYHIRYTTDDTNPTASSPIMEGRSFLVTSSLTLKAVVERYGIVLTAVATKALVPAPCAAPIITFDNTTSKVSITCTTAGSTIYYTIDGSTPTASSTAYSIPFSVTSPTTVKAIATHATFATSDVAEFAISQVASPTIQNNGSNAISITTTTPSATIYYTTDGSTPTTSSTEYIGPLTDNVSNVTIKAIAVKEGMITSTVGSGSAKLQCAMPFITRVGLTFTLSCSKPADANLYYILGDGSEVAYSGTPVSFDAALLPMTVTAVARHNDYTQSETASMELKNGTGTPDDPYLIYGATDFATFVTNVNNGTTASACYKLGSDVSAAGIAAITSEFTGTFDGNGYTISNLGNALFNSVNGGTVKNVILDAVSISGGTNAGAIANKLIGTSSKRGSIYNCGALSGSISGSGYVGSIVGQLGDSNNDNCYARVINCYSYATVGGGSDVGGIVGYNCFATTATNIRTMVMNCMFYGDIESGTSVSPVYGGENIDNLQGGLNTFNYYAYSQLTTATITKYNCALAVEEKYLNRFEFYRLLLNSNKKLAAFYATGSHDNANQKMMKWVLETADRTIEKPKPYPVLKAQGRYPSIINPDFENAPDSALVGRNHGGKLRKTLSVTISGVGSNAPTGASITTGSLTLQRTDKDFDRFNFNYDKVQLPYYNDIGTGNYTGNRVVTGWKITAIDAVTDDPYTSANYDYTKTYASNQTYFDYPNYNFADRKSSNKDLYSVSGRVFSQGAYFDVPYGVNSITIEPYWGKACYIADQNYDVVYKNDYTGKQNVSQTGTQVTVGTTKFNEQDVQKSIEPALTYITNNLGGLGSTVYDNALVLVGNLHLDVVPLNGDRPFTMMSVDADNDHEPDYSLIYHHKSRSNITPIRFDFLAVPGTAQVQKPNGASLICNFTIFKPRGWFEVTNTAFMYSSQIEYENGDLGTGVTKIDAPLILLGGVFDQFVSTQSSSLWGRTIYIHVGGNVCINSFGLGTHSDGSKSTPHVPVSVTGGDYEGFYLTGTYNQNADERTDNAECYISSGHFKELAGASQEGIDGDVRWQIYNADIDDFFGAGTNENRPVKGDVTVDICNSYVTTYCGGPKFGNMQDGKVVTTNADGCTFGNYFGAGYGGLSYSRIKYYDNNDDPVNWTTQQNKYITDRGKYFDGETDELKSNNGKVSYGYKGIGVATDFDYEYFVWSSGTTGGRFFVKFASFSLAQCNNVISNLKKCVVNKNFYGGGNLGKVLGTATSVLTDCDIRGSVYGGGYSASLPTVEVRDGGFKTAPNFNKSSGMFEPGEKTGVTIYEWKHVDDLPDNGDPGTEDDKYVLTNKDLTTLGRVHEANLTIKGSTTVLGSVYGGGALASMDTDGTTQVNLLGGTIEEDVYGGGEGRLPGMKDNEGKDLPEVKAMVGSTKVNLNGMAKADYDSENPDHVALMEAYPSGATGDAIEYYTLKSKDANNLAITGCVVKGNIFGCNNLNGTPKGDVTVNIYKTQGYDGHQRTGANAENLAAMEAALDDIDDSHHTYEVKAVYGGGNLAAYEPNDPNNKQTLVNIYGCGDTSIKQVYGGGNAASTPATEVHVYGTYEIEEVFGGGNGKDDISRDGGTTFIKNPGANVGFKDYWDYEKEMDMEAYNTKDKRQDDDFINNYVYGSGEAHVNIHGGRTHRVYGGSNTKGNVKTVAVTMLEDVSGCDFKVDEAYGGGKSAPMDGASRLEMACIPGLKNAYGGAEAADIQNDVTLNITNGTFQRVFGGNNVSGTIRGTITVNIEETGCHPIIIGQLYGGGNQAAYTAPLKQGSETEREDGPTVNVKSFTSIGDVYGGGYGITATVIGDTHVNINECEGINTWVTSETNHWDETTEDISSKTGEKTFSITQFVRTKETTEDNPLGFVYKTDGQGNVTDERETEEIDIKVFLPFTSGQRIGAINNVFGGGNAAEVVGNTTVNIGTNAEVYMVDNSVKAGNSLGSDHYTLGTDGKYTAATGDAEDGKTYYKKYDVLGADIRGNVYGGGNNAEVTGNTNVVIGKQETTTTTP